jgi:hypothetical protein
MKVPVNPLVSDDSIYAFVDAKDGRGPIVFVNMDCLMDSIEPNRAGRSVIAALRGFKTEALAQFVSYKERVLRGRL